MKVFLDLLDRNVGTKSLHHRPAFVWAVGSCAIENSDHLLFSLLRELLSPLPGSKIAQRGVNETLWSHLREL